MRDQWETWISAIENIQEEFRHNIQKIKERLARLTSLFENHIKIEAVHPRGPSPLPNQQVTRPFIQTMSYLPCKIDRPNIRQPRPTAPSTFMATSRPVDRSNNSKGKPSEQKIDKCRRLIFSGLLCFRHWAHLWRVSNLGLEPCFSLFIYLSNLWDIQY